MREQILIIAFIAISNIELYSQIIFEEGYFIDESNKKIECLIRNIDWKNNPIEFEYKLSSNLEVQKATVQTVKEFGINNASRYIRAKTQIDRSSDDLDRMSSDRNPSFKEELLFLKVLIEGHASLFYYSDGNLIRMFYKLDDSEIEQLVYKRFLNDGRISQNNYFKQQLFLKLKCEEIGLNDLERLRYSKGDLERLFIKYNECTSSNYINYELKEKKDFFNLTIRPGLSYSSLEIQNSMSDSKDTDFGNHIGMRLGIEAEFILPFNKNKWGIIIEPTYQYFKSEHSQETSTVSGGILVSKVDYSSIELPIGVRHYIYLNDKSKLFANVSCVFDFPYNSSIQFFRINGSLHSAIEINSSLNIALGVGFKYNDKYSLEIRYNRNRNIVSEYLFWNSNYNSLNVICGFSLF